MECGAWQAGDREGRPYGGLQGVPCGRTGASAPTDMWKRLRRAGLQEVRKNGPSGTPAPTDGLLMVPYAAGHMGPALHYIIL